MASKSDNAIKWLEELKTTELKQAKYELGNEEFGFCCLGLGCKVLDIPYCESFAGNNELDEAVGFLNHSGRGGTKISPVDMNDDEGFDFKQIADQLIKYAETYFKPEVADKVKAHFA